MFYLRRLVSVSTSNKRSIESIKLLYNSANLRLYSSQTKPDQKPPVVLSDNCLKRLKELKSASPSKRLRILVDSGGCSGFEYKFSLDTEAKSDDIIVEKEGCEVLIDKASLPYIEGATLDHYEELIRTGFRVINNPNSEQGCSCGSSFSIKIWFNTMSSKLISTSIRAVKASRKLAPSKAAITLTPAALDRVKQLMKRQPDMAGLRIGVKQRGCSGLSYTLEYAKEKNRLDEVVEQNGVKIFVDAKAQLSLLGTEMDFMNNDLSSEFVFNNPNIKGTCGCGESFQV